MFPTLLHAAKTTRIGLDLGAYGVRAAQLTRRSQNYALKVFARVERHRFVGESVRQAAGHTPRLAGASRPAGTMTSPAAFIRNCLHQERFRGIDVRTGLSMPDIDFHTLELPETIMEGDTQEVERIVQWEVQRLTTNESEKLETRHWLLPAARPSAPNAIGTAAKEAMVLSVVNMCRDAGFVCTQVDATPIALARFGNLVCNWSSEVVWGILDLGLRQTRLVLCTDDKSGSVRQTGGNSPASMPDRAESVPVLVRHAGPGGAAWTKRIADSLQVSEKTAEFHKREAGIELIGRGVRKDDTDTPSSELGAILTGILRNDLNGIAAEVKRSYEYVLSCYDSRRAGGLILVGGGAALRNLPEYLTNALGIPVHRASHHMLCDETRIDVGVCDVNIIDEMAVAIALAIET